MYTPYQIIVSGSSRVLLRSEKKTGLDAKINNKPKYPRFTLNFNV